MDATRRLLLVEDDPLLRMTLAEVLTEAGFTVVEAADAESALRLVASRDDLDLLLTDINLPGADGFALASAARRLRPRCWPRRGVLTPGESPSSCTAASQ